MRGLSLCANLPFSVPSIEDITDKLPKKGPWEALKRKWTVKGVWDGRTYCVGFRTPDQIDTIIVHHSGSPEGTLQSHASYHASKWGAGIAYHVSIDKGRIYQTNDLLSMTYHAGNNNTYTVGVMVNRDLTKADLTDEERNLLYAAILSVKAAIPTIKFILGHNEVCPTQCPATSMDRIRKDIAELEHQVGEHDTYSNSLNSQAVDAFAAYQRVEVLWTNYNTEKWKPAAETKLLWLAAVTGCDTPKAIYERIKDLYMKAQDGKYQGEAIRKLLAIAAAMKERGAIIASVFFVIMRSEVMIVDLRKHAELIQKHMKEAHDYNPSIEALLDQPYDRIMSYYFNALSYFKMENHYRSLDEITEPVEGKTYYIREPTTRRTYMYINGKFRFHGDCPDSALR